MGVITKHPLGVLPVATSSFPGPPSKTQGSCACAQQPTPAPRHKAASVLEGLFNSVKSDVAQLDEILRIR